MIITELNTGPGAALYAVVKKDVCSVKEFISKLHRIDSAQLFAVFQLILQKGDPRNEQKFRYLGDQIYEIKTNSGIRILCFKGNHQLKNSIILTHGLRKTKNKILQREKAKSLKLYKEFIGGNINIID